VPFARDPALRPTPARRADRRIRPSSPGQGARCTFLHVLPYWPIAVDDRGFLFTDLLLGGADLYRPRVCGSCS